MPVRGSDYAALFGGGEMSKTVRTSYGLVDAKVRARLVTAIAGNLILVS